MKFIRLMRHKDVHDNTGTGCVMIGMVFPGGHVAYMFQSQIPIMSWTTSIDNLRLHEHGHHGEIEEFGIEKYNSMSTLISFFAGEPMKEINKKLKKKYLPKEDDDEQPE